jgi:hypothetical protein
VFGALVRTAAFLIDARRRFLTAPIQSGHPSRLRTQGRRATELPGPSLSVMAFGAMPHMPTMRPMVSIRKSVVQRVFKQRRNRSAKSRRVHAA